MNGATIRLLAGRALRRQLPAILGLALVIGLVGGPALAALSGARRTASSFARYLDDSHASDLSVDFFPFEEDEDLSMAVAGLAVLEQAEQIEGIESSATYVGMESMLNLDEQGQPADFESVEVIGSLDGRFFTQDRIVPVDGELPRIDAFDEALINQPLAADLGVGVGDELRFGVYDINQDPATISEAGPVEQVTVRITGVGTIPEDVGADEFDRFARIVITPALTRRYLELAGGYPWHGIRLEPGVSEETVLENYRALAFDQGFAVIAERTSDQKTSVQRALRPVIVALAAFGAVTIVAALALGALGAVRLSSTAIGGEREATALRALGIGSRTVALITAAPAIAAVLLGSVAGVVLAVALSPLAPVGAVRDIEPRRGMDVDLTVLGVGLAMFVVLLVLLALVGAWRQTHRWDRAAIVSATRRPLLPTGQLRSPAAIVGVRDALPGARGAAAPARATVIAGAIAIVAVLSALIFAASVQRLFDRPSTYGFWSDVVIVSGSGYEPIDSDAVAAYAAGQDDVAAMTLASFGPVVIGGRTIPSIGIEASVGEIDPAVISGRPPVAADEVALGAITADDLSVGVGDQIAVATDDGTESSFDVVGIVALPAVGQITSGHPSLGDGALFTLAGIQGRGQGAGAPVVAFVDFADGVDRDEAAARSSRGLAEASGILPELMTWYPDLRPAELADSDQAGVLAAVLSGLLVVAAVVGMGFTVATSVRRRRRDHAILKVLGFSRRDLRATVLWQAGVVAGLALLIGVPLGIASGRLAWEAFADTLGVVPEPVVPIVGVVAVAVALTVLALAVATIPARVAARARPVDILRSP